MRRTRTDWMESKASAWLLRGLVIATILLGPLVIPPVHVAGAHAVVESSSPADGAVVASSPERVSVTFSESVSLVTGSLRVFDSDGKRVDTGVPSKGAAASVVQVALKPHLPDGSYAVSWRVISADSHPIHGGFVFSVEKPGSVENLDELIDQPAQTSYQVAGAVLRAVGYLASFIVVGAAMFVVFVARRGSVAASQAFRGVLAVCALLGVASQVLLLPVSATLATGQGPGSVFSDGVLGEVLGQGVWVTIAGVSLACVAGLAALLRTAADRRVWAVVSLVAVAAAFVASGHTRATEPAWLAYVAAVVHVAAAAVWVGGVMALVWSLRARGRSDAPSEPDLAAAEVVGFSRIAAVSIVAVGVAGVALAWVEIRSLHALVSTTYGRLVLVKVGLIVVLGALGAFNHFRLLPAVQRRPDRGARWRYLRTTVRLEALAMVVVLGVTGVLVNTEPARNVVASQSLFSDTVEIESGSVNVVIDPARTGSITLHVYILDDNGRPDDSVQGVSVSLVQPELDIGPLDHDLDHAGPGHFLTNDTLFTVPGKWKVTFHVRVDEFTERAGTVDVDVGS